jgi:Spy/CpxP family protein refolding chaperone
MQRLSYKTAGLTTLLALALVGSVQAQQQQQQQPRPGAAQTSQPQPAGAGQGAPGPSQMTDQMQGMMGNMQGMMEHMQGMMEHMQGMMGGGGMTGHRGMRGMQGMMGRQSGLEQEEDDDEEASPQRGMRGRRGMRGHGLMDMGDVMHHGGMIPHHLERLARHLELTEEQRTQMWTVLGNQAKEAIRLKADLETLAIDLRQLLEADPVDLARVKPLLQSMAGKEADLRLLHITALQEMGKMLTPEQRQKLRAMRHSMMGHGGMMGHHGMQDMGERKGPGGMRGHRPATQ